MDWTKMILCGGVRLHAICSSLTDFRHILISPFSASSTIYSSPLPSSLISPIPVEAMAQITEPKESSPFSSPRSQTYEELAYDKLEILWATIIHDDPELYPPLFRNLSIFKRRERSESFIDLLAEAYMHPKDGSKADGRE